MQGVTVTANLNQPTCNHFLDFFLTQELASIYRVTIKINFICGLKPASNQGNNRGNLIFFHDRKRVGINRLITIIKGNQNGFAW